MRNALKKMAGGLGAAVLALVVAAGACQASVIVDLSLDVDPGAKTWEAYLTLDDTGKLGTVPRKPGGNLGDGTHVFGPRRVRGSIPA